MQQIQTIAAISTGSTPGGIGIVRLSGPMARQAAAVDEVAEAVESAVHDMDIVRNLSQRQSDRRHGRNCTRHRKVVQGQFPCVGDMVRDGGCDAVVIEFQVDFMCRRQYEDSCDE